MFAIIARSARTLFSRLTSISEDTTEASPGKQLQAELHSRASETSMVTTRSQDHSQEGSALMRALDSHSGIRPRKRKNVEGMPVSTNYVTKRRRSSPSGGDKAGRNGSPKLDEAAVFVVDSQPVQGNRKLALRTVDSQKTPIQSPFIVTSEAGLQFAPGTQVMEETQFSADQSVYVPEAGLGAQILEPVEASQVVSSIEDELSKTPVVTHSAPPLKTTSDDTAQATSLPTEPQKQTNASRMNTDSRLHRRFGSEEPVIPESVRQINGTLTATKDDQDDVLEDRDSDDEAPETVTASAGQGQAQVAAAKAAKAHYR